MIGMKGAISRETIVEGFSDLPSLPIVIQKLQGLIENDNIDITTVATIIEADPGFTARVLKLVNSPFYGLSRQVSSVSDAITILGFNAVHQLLLTTSILNIFDSEVDELSIKSFWRHSFGVGTIAKSLLYKKDKDTLNEIFLCGTLHDIGRLVFLRIDPQLFSWFYFKQGSVTNIEDESKYFGISHQEAGQMLAQKWNFPKSIVAAIGQHHSPLEAEDHQLHAAAINIADMVSHALDIGNSGNAYISEFYPEAWALLDLDMKQFEERVILALDDFEEQQETINELL